MKRSSAISVLPVAALLGLAGCKKPVAQGGPPPPPVVEFVHPVEQTIVAWDEYTGRLEPVETVEVRARVGGMLDKIHFTDGQIVEKGALLFTIDPGPYQAELNAAQADLTQAKASRDLAGSNLERGKNLLRSNAIAKEEVDIRSGTFAESEAAVQAAAARVESAQLNVGYTEVRAPITGRTADRFITQGNLISGGTAASTLLTTIVSVDPIYCSIEADENSVLKYMRLNQEGKRVSARQKSFPIKLGLSDEDGFPREGILDFVNNTFDSATATMRARATFPNPDGFLTPGMFAKVRLPGRGEFTAMLIPEVAIQTSQSHTSVLAVDEKDIVQSITVKLGSLEGDMRVIESGLTTADRVIVSGMFLARPKSPATPKEKAAAPAAAAPENSNR